MAAFSLTFGLVGSLGPAILMVKKIEIAIFSKTQARAQQTQSGQPREIFWFTETDISTCFVGRVYRLTQQENEMVFTQRLLSALEMLIDHIICSWAEIQRQGQFI